MPIFRYHCPQCGRDLELLLPRWSSPAVCPGCGSKELQKLNTTFAAVSGRSAGCPHRDGCESAGGHGCGCGCGCGHHH